ncbi:MAG: Uma2 family endonuclease [Armatimonadetes bacterium]|nr:Uma2 family endonuclease [Armatimonadota bacterium]
MSTATKIKHSYDDLQRLPDDNQRHELINGDLIMTPAPNVAHQQAVGNLHAGLHHFITDNRLGNVYTAPLDVVFSSDNVVEPDILFISKGRADILTPNNVQGAPDLIVEVLSPNTEENDRQIKFRLYEQFGASEYWIVDPSALMIEVYSLAGERYERLGRFSGEEMIQSKVLIGFECQTSEVFEQ